MFRSFSIYTSMGFINKVMPFMLLPILTRFLSPADYGLLATFTAIMGLANVIISMGSVEAVVRAYFDRHISNFNFPKYTFNATIINFTAFLIMSVLIMIFKIFISQKLCIPANWIILFPIIGVCSAVYIIPTKLFIFENRPLSYATVEISNGFIELALSILFVVGMGLNWQGRVLGITVNSVLFFVIGVFILLRSKLLKFSFDYRYIKNILQYGIPVAIHSLGIAAVATIDKLFLNRMVGLSETGVYSVAYTISGSIGFLVGSFNFAWNPFLYERLGQPTQKLKVKLVKFTYLYFIVLVLIALLLVFTAPVILKFLVGKNFSGASKYIFWIALGYAVYGMQTKVVPYILYQKKTYLLSMISGIVVIVNIILNYTFINANGAMGAAQATFLTFFTRFILSWYFSNRVYPMPWFSFLKLKVS